ncbi:MAG: nucleotidyltransferase family protein [Novosphingobium sp.]
MNDSERSIVGAILQKHLTPDIMVHVFGSRASGRCKPWSDLDLVLEAAEPLPLTLIAALREAFEDSALPWKVDIIDRKAVSGSFGRLIDQSKVHWN